MDSNTPRKSRKRRQKPSKKAIKAISGVFFGKERYLRVVDQPKGNPGFVASISKTATKFRLAEKYGNIGLIAHNYLGGRYFHKLKVGDEIHVMDGHGEKKLYKVKEMLRYQAVDPRNVRSDFINLDDKQLCSATDVFKRVYTGKHRLVLQTCIKKGKNEEWGRKFIIAFPA